MSMSRVLAVAMLGFAGLAAQAASVPAGSEGVLSVTGQGKVDVPTTETTVQASIQKVQNCNQANANKCDGKNAQQEASKAMANVISYLKSMDGVSKLTTTNIQLQPEYTYSSDGKPPTLNDYKATSSISFNVGSDEAGEVLNNLLDKGITNIDNVGFVASDEALSDAQDEALKKAVNDAQKQADAVLAAIGQKQTSIVGVQVGDASPPAPIPMMAMAAAPAPGSNDKMVPPIEGGTQTVQAAVTLNVKYE